VTVDALSRLRAALDEDERIAQVALKGPARLEPNWHVVTYEVTHEGASVLGSRPASTVSDSSGVFIAPELGRQSEHIARHDPAREVAEVALKRLILHHHKPREFDGDEDIETGHRPTALYCVECSTMVGNGIDDAPWPCDYIKALQAIYPEVTS
jgi:hypothetical protein